MINLYSSNNQIYITVLEGETGVALNWRLKQNHMIANAEKFNVIFIKKDHQTNLSGESLKIEGEQIRSEETIKLPLICLDYKLHFEKHISEICRKAASQLDVLKMF